MRTVNAYGATSASDPLIPMKIDRRDPGPHDVLVDIKYCGICHSDIHHARSEWQAESYPMVPGHEITGIVEAIGSAVTRHAVGDRVGVGSMVDSCRKCVNCRNGYEQHCLRGFTLTYGAVGRDGQPTQGGYATHIVVDEHFVLKVPDGLALDVAAPLLCPGVTTYVPLRRWGAGPGKRVAVVGLGGLGHLAVKLAHAMGAQVTVLSHSPKKKDDGLRLGADDFYATTDPATFTTLANSFDLVISTVSVPIDVGAYLALLAVDGVMVNVGAPEAFSLDQWLLFHNDRALAGSLIGGIDATQELLDFCAARQVAAEIELTGVDQINEAYDRVKASDVCFRFVIDTSTLR